MISVLIAHPEEGLILFETGAGKDYPEVWGPQLIDLFAREDYTEDMELDAAIKKTGNDIKDVKAVIIGHLHLDHAGGLEHFRNTGIPIYAHELELKNAFYSVATKTDLGKSSERSRLMRIRDRMRCNELGFADVSSNTGLYLPSYLQFDINWQPFHGDGLAFAQGIYIHHCPGHTPGLCIVQLNLKNSKTWIFTSDQYIVQENYDSLGTQGWLTRDHATWSRSNQMVHFLQKMTAAKLVFGHDKEVFMKYKIAPEHYD